MFLSKKNIILFFLFMIFITTSVFAWEIDFSRRTKKRTEASTSSTAPATGQENQPTKSKIMDFVSKVSSRETIADRQEIVILNTGKSFVPSNVRVKKGVHYTIHVVNVSKDNKNVSFMLDAFSQHHSTYFGETKSFKLDPEKEGVFEFQCPETSAEGKLVVYGPQASPALPERSQASESAE